jgi:hypothetical protein
MAEVPATARGDLLPRVADLIAGNTPMPPADVPYYRHRADMLLSAPGDSRNNEGEVR